MVDSDSSLPSSPELLHELRKQLAEAQQQAKTLQAEFQEDLSRLKKQNAIPRLPLVGILLGPLESWMSCQCSIATFLRLKAKSCQSPLLGFQQGAHMSCGGVWGV